MFFDSEAPQSPAAWQAEHADSDTLRTEILPCPTDMTVPLCETSPVAIFLKINSFND